MQAFLKVLRQADSHINLAALSANGKHYSAIIIRQSVSKVLSANILYVGHLSCPSSVLRGVNQELQMGSIIDFSLGLLLSNNRRV